MMRFVKGDNVEEQVFSIDRVLTKFSRKLHKTVTGLITPYPISNYVKDPIDDAILHYMFPAAGRITKCYLFVECLPKDGVRLVARIDGKVRRSEESYGVKGTMAEISPSVSVETGDRLSIFVKKFNEADTISGVWISFLWVPKINETDIRNQLIDALESVEEHHAKSSNK